jgi:Glycosyltransferase family 87
LEKLKEVFRYIISSRWVAWGIVLLTVLVTLKAIYGPISYKGVYTLTPYNNFLIFKQSFYHLIEHKSLYAKYEVEHWDLYKYSPTFAFLFAVCALPPLGIGLMLWSLLNVGVLLYAIRLLPRIQATHKNILLLFIAPELLLSIMNEQSNALMAGLIILTFALLEKKHLFWACACLALSIYIKLFSVVVLALFIFYPQKIKAAAYFVFWMALLFALPLLVINWNELLWQYTEWFVVLKNDTVTDYSYSVMMILDRLSGVDWNDRMLQMASGLLTVLPLVQYKKFTSLSFRYYMLASLLIWSVIFNHKAESPTFIIAVSGVALWYFAAPRATWRTCLLLAVLVFTSLSTSDIFPKIIREEIFRPLMMKSWPCIIVWLVILVESFRLNFIDDEHQSKSLAAEND